MPIDVHAHVVPAGYLAAMELSIEPASQALAMHLNDRDLAALHSVNAASLFPGLAALAGL